MKVKAPITDFLHHKVIINQKQRKPFFIYAGLEGRVVGTKVFKSSTLYQIHFSKSEPEIKKYPELNDIWFTKDQFELTR